MKTRTLVISIALASLAFSSCSSNSEPGAVVVPDSSLVPATQLVTDSAKEELSSLDADLQALDEATAEIESFNTTTILEAGQ
jgi:hypothetical protein